MKKALLGCATLALLAVGCHKNDYDSMMKETIGIMNDMADTLAGIKDEASAKAAVPKLQALQQKGEDMKKRMDGMQKPTKEQEDALKKKYEPEMQAAVSKMMKETMRVAAMPGGADVMKAMRPAPKN